MKQLVIIIGTAILGCIIYEMMVGDDADSLKSIVMQVIGQARYQYG